MTEASEAVIRQCQAGDIRGLEEVYRLYGQRIFALCLRMTGDATKAEDLVQEILLRVFEQIGKFSGRSKLSTWLYRLAVNHTLNEIKRDQLRSHASLGDVPLDVLPESDLPMPEEAAARAEEREFLDRLLARLAPEMRAVMVLREIEGLAYREIAEVLGIPIGTVMSRLSRARDRLREQLVKEE